MSKHFHVFLITTSNELMLAGTFTNLKDAENYSETLEAKTLILEGWS